MDVHVDCICPPLAGGGIRHPGGDTVTLRERLGFRAAVTARNTMLLAKSENPDAGAADILALLTETYLLVGIEGWTLVNGRNDPLEVSRAAIRAFMDANPDTAMTIGDAADELYGPAVILPLLARAQTSSPPTPIDGSTSAPTAGSPRPRRPSKRSSISTIPTDVTATTSASPAGASSYSPS